MTAIAVCVGYFVAAVAFGALLLYWRDKKAKREGKTPEQIRARFASLLQFRATLYRAIPGVLLIIFGAFFLVDFRERQDSSWWLGLLFIVIGWTLVPLLARKSWNRYLELKKIAEAENKPFVYYKPIE